MRSTTWLAGALLVIAAATASGCGDDTTPTMMPDMAIAPPPAAYIEARDGSKTPANLGCVGTRTDGTAPTQDTVVTGKVKDFQDDDPVAGAVVSVYTDAAQVAMKKPVASSPPSAADGTFTVTVPKGFYRVIFGTSGGKALSSGGSMTETIDTFEFGRRYDDKDRIAVKTTTRDAIQGLVSTIPNPALGVIAGSVRDCDEREFGGGRVVVSGTSAPFNSAEGLFYFTNIGGADLPTRTQKHTSGNGVFAALNVPVGQATVTASAVIGAGELKTVGAATVPVLAGAITIVEIYPTAAK